MVVGGFIWLISSETKSSRVANSGCMHVAAVKHRSNRSSQISLNLLYTFKHPRLGAVHAGKARYLRRIGSSKRRTNNPNPPAIAPMCGRRDRQIH